MRNVAERDMNPPIFEDDDNDGESNSSYFDNSHRIVDSHHTTTQ